MKDCGTQTTRHEALTTVGGIIRQTTGGSTDDDVNRAAVALLRLRITRGVAEGRICESCAAELLSALADVAEWLFDPADLRTFEQLFNGVPDFVPAGWAAQL